ncbi:MAG TPA: hypothetical protein VNW47_17710 [Terriglobales bacterium]|nr:hypothetical protein [Terriglobales bacterium]
MTRSRFLISSAWLLQVAAWFLPVVTSIGGGRIDPLYGLGAFLAASSAVWPGATFLGTWYDAALATLSVVTTIVFIVGSPWVALRGTRSLQRASAGAAAVAFLVNAHWYVLLSPNGWVSGLGIGYFLWWSSFLVLATGLFDLAGQQDAAESTYNQTALLPR